MKIRFIKSSEKKKIIETLNKEFGIEEIPYLLIESGKEKIRAFSGHLSKEEISEIAQIARVELIGIYAIKRESELRLTVDFMSLISRQISKNVLDLDDKQFNLWLRGNNLEIESSPGIYAIRHKGDFFGCGKSNGKLLFNYVPKDRRLKR